MLTPPNHESIFSAHCNQFIVIADYRSEIGSLPLIATDVVIIQVDETLLDTGFIVKQMVHCFVQKIAIMSYPPITQWLLSIILPIILLF